MANSYLSRTFGSTGNRKTFTISVWVKRSSTGENNYIFDCPTSSNHDNAFRISNGDQFGFGLWNGSDVTQVVTNAKLRDCNGFYHLVASVDTTQATASNRVKLYINGELQTSLSSSSYPSQNYDYYINQNIAHYIGYKQPDNARYFNGLMTHVNFIDGTAYAPTSFGQSDSNGVWIPKPSPSVTYGTNGFFLKMDNSGNMGLDSSGNSNNFTTSGTITQAKDTPSNVFATMNALATNSNITLSNGNLTLQSSYGTDNASSYSTLGATQGKWYWELKYTTGTLATSARVAGVIHVDSFTFVNGERASTSGTAGIALLQDGSTENSGTTTSAGSYMSALSTGDIIGIALDCDNGQVKFNKNGGTFGSDLTFATNDNGYYSAIDMRTSSGTSKVEVNFGNGYFGTTAVTSAGANASGNGIFEYDVPTGYTALSTKGLDS